MRRRTALALTAFAVLAATELSARPCSRPDAAGMVRAADVARGDNDLFVVLHGQFLFDEPLRPQPVEEGMSSFSYVTARFKGRILGATGWASARVEVIDVFAGCSGVICDPVPENADWLLIARLPNLGGVTVPLGACDAQAIPFPTRAELNAAEACLLHRACGS